LFTPIIWWLTEGAPITAAVTNSEHEALCEEHAVQNFAAATNFYFWAKSMTKFLMIVYLFYEELYFHLKKMYIM